MRQRNRPGIARMLIGLIAAAALAGPSAIAAGQTQPAPGGTLYDRLGGREGIAAVVGDFVARVGSDERINRYFQGANLDNLRKHLTDQICKATGGSCEYAGRDMKTVHAGMGISNAEFMALMQDLMASLEKHKVGKEDSGALAGLLLPMKKDIVEKP